MSNLVIVESPVKAKALQNYLGSSYNVLASYGHIRDLTKRTWKDKNSNNGYKIDLNSKEVDLNWAVDPKSKKNILEISKSIKKINPEFIYLASDPDREGEAIAWHLGDELKLLENKNVSRVVFHEITKSAIKNSFDNPQTLDLNLVNAYKARRVMDRIVGFEISGPLSSAIRVGGRSTGRVQGPALLIVNNRENEIKAHNPTEYWTIESELIDSTKKKFNVSLRGNLEDANYYVFDIKKSNNIISNKKIAESISEKIKKSILKVNSIKKSEFISKPRPPFITSTLQQTASNVLRLSPRKTMDLAQQLFRGIESGNEVLNLITYMRTDSTFLSDEILNSTGKYINEKYGKEFYEGHRKYSKKSINAQEAHEAIRPTNIFNNPEKIKDKLNTQQYNLYKLIWERTLASQMKNSLTEKTVVLVEAKFNDKEIFFLNSEYNKILFDGFKIIDGENQIDVPPNLSIEDIVKVSSIKEIQNYTKPKNRFTEASLIKELETSGIGRPSTYAGILDRIQQHSAVVAMRRSLHRTNVGKSMINTLKPIYGDHFMSLEFTSNIEQQLDNIAQGNLDWQSVVCEFYEIFNERLNKLREVGNDSKLVNPSSSHHFTDIHCPKCTGTIELCENLEFDKTNGLREKSENCENIHMKWIPIKRKKSTDDGAFLACEKGYVNGAKTDHKSSLSEKCWTTTGRNRKSILDYENDKLKTSKIENNR